MIWLILGISVTVGLFIGLGFYEDEYNVKWKLQKTQFFAVFGLLICMLGCFKNIPANHVGIVYSPFGGTKNETITEGLKKKNPLDKIYTISTELQTVTVSDLTTQTNDAQYVTSVMDVKYKVNPSNAFLVFKQFRTLDKLSENLIMPTTQRVLELITTNYNVIDILGSKRSDVYDELKVKLAEELALYGVDFDSVTILDMDAGEKLEAAITEEAVAKKAVETAEQNLLKAKTEAQKKSVEAQAEQDAAKIKAETKLINAQAEKDANELLDQSLSEDVLQKKWIDKWNGELPAYYGGNADLMIGIDTK